LPPLPRTWARSLTQVIDRVGKNGSAIIKESQTLFDEVKFTKSLTIDRGYTSPYFVKDHEHTMCKLVNARVMVTDAKINNTNEILPLLE
jgi:chaperonin GroEL